MERHRRRPQQNVGPQQDGEMQPAVWDAAAKEQDAAQMQTVQSAAKRRRRAQTPSTQEHEHSENAAPVQAEKKDRTPAAKQKNTKRPERRSAQKIKTGMPAERTDGQRILKAPKAREKREDEETLGRQYTGKIKRSQLLDAQRVHAAQAKASIQKAAAGADSALGRLGGMALPAIMSAGKGFRKLGARIAQRIAGKRSRVSPHGHAPQRDEYILEAIRPEDYHGRAQSRTEQMNSRAHSDLLHPHTGARKAAAAQQKRQGEAAAHGRWRRPDLQQIISLVLAGVAVFSFCMIVSILWRTVRTTRLNKQLTQMYNQASAVQTPAPQDEAQEMIVFMPEETPQKAELTDEAERASAAYAQKDESEQTAQFGPTEEPAITPLPMGKRKYHHIGGDALPQMEALHKENRDIVGWLKIENVLDQPVVYRDNSYYLTRDFYKQKNAAGTIFLDVNHPFKEKTQNLLLHGHNMKDGTMFGRLLQYETDLNYVRWHPFVRFDTLWRQEEYVIFAVLRVSLDVRSKDFFNYFTHATFSSDAEFESYIRQLQLRSIYAIPIDVKPTDALLTMSTCLEDDRLVIVARRVREGETHMQLREWTNLTTRQ